MEELIDYLITQDTSALIDNLAEAVLNSNTTRLLRYVGSTASLIICLLAVDDARSGLEPTSKNTIYQKAYELASDRLRLDGRFAELADGSVEL